MFFLSSLFSIIVYSTTDFASASEGVGMIEVNPMALVWSFICYARSLKYIDPWIQKYITVKIDEINLMY